MSKKRVVLFSGGMDSTTVLARSICHVGAENVLPLSFKYGSKHNAKEAIAVEYLLQHYEIPESNQIFVNLEESLGALAYTSVLLHPDRAVPRALDGQQTSTVVPGRNTIMLAFGIAVAEIHEAEAVEFGACEDDHLSYPDCRPMFVHAMAEVARQSTDRRVLNVSAPFVHWSKKDILSLGLSLRVPYSYTHTCYVGQLIACGECDACVERIRAFQLNKVIDPIPYAVAVDWTDCEPYKV